jgi:hypothetical protein
LEVYAVGAKEGREQAAAWSDQHELTYSVIADPEGKVFKQCAAGSVPYHIIIDRNFNVALSQEAFDKELLIRMTEKALSM